MRIEKKFIFKEEASTSYGKVDVLARILEIIIDRLENMERKNHWENQQQQTPIRNPKFRKNHNTTKNATLDEQISPPFQENYVEDSQNQEAEYDTQINILETMEEDTIFLTQ